nr:hypothetical protein [Tanacetum cinerariifolium]
MRDGSGSCLNDGGRGLWGLGFGDGSDTGGNVTWGVSDGGVNDGCRFHSGRFGDDWRSFRCFKVLILSSCDRFSNYGLAAIAANCRNLRELDLQESQGEDFSRHWLSHFLNACTLESLNMSCLSLEVSLSALQRLVARSPNLKTRAVQLEKFSTLLLRAPHHMLTFLNLSYATIESPDVSKIISQCPNLQRLWGKFAFESLVKNKRENDKIETKPDQIKKKQEAWRSRKKSKAVTVNRGRKTE